MARAPKVKLGTAELLDGTTEKVAWLETTITYEWELEDLVQRLGSKFFRFEVTEDDSYVTDRPEELPERIAPAELLRICRDEQEEYGNASLWSWTEGLNEGRERAARVWLQELVLDAFPDLGTYR